MEIFNKGNVPWDYLEDDEVQTMLLSGTATQPKRNPNFPSEVHFAIIWCMKFNPKDRPTFQELFDRYLIY